MTNHSILFCLLVAVVAIKAFPQPATDVGVGTDTAQNVDIEDFNDVPMETVLEVDGDRAKRSADPQYREYGHQGGYRGHQGGRGNFYEGRGRESHHHGGSHYRGRRSANPEPQWGGYGGYGGGYGGYGGGYGGYGGGYGGHRGGYGGHRHHHRGGYYG